MFQQMGVPDIRVRRKMRWPLGLGIVLALLLVAGFAQAKTLYVISDMYATPMPIQTYYIEGDSLTYQATYYVTKPSGAWGGIDLAIDTGSQFLFITYEGSNVIQWIDASTMVGAGTTAAPGASNLSGVVVDEENQKVYTVDCNTNHLYVYDWDAVNETLTFESAITLAGTQYAQGIALDEVNDLLYVGDRTRNVKYYDTNTWTMVGSFTVTHYVAGLAIDERNQYVYTGSAYYGSPNYLLSKYDLSTAVEQTVYVGSSVLGVAVDTPTPTGLVYVTTYANGTYPQKLIVYNSDLNVTWMSGDIGRPTGICIEGVASGGPVPALSVWGMIVCSILLAGIAVHYMRRQHKV